MLVRSEYLSGTSGMSHNQFSQCFFFRYGSYLFGVRKFLGKWKWSPHTATQRCQVEYTHLFYKNIEYIKNSNRDTNNSDSNNNLQSWVSSCRGALTTATTQQQQQQEEE